VPRLRATCQNTQYRRRGKRSLFCLSPSRIQVYANHRAGALATEHGDAEFYMVARNVGDLSSGLHRIEEDGETRQQSVSQGSGNLARVRRVSHADPLQRPAGFRPTVIP
jgi:hypothetical protein